MGNIITNKAFTLIEMLVVVLIIGILAAIALPRYMLAVDQSKLSQAILSARALAEAQTRYQLANGNWSADISALDISLDGGTLTSDKTYMYYSWGFCYTACGLDNHCGGCALRKGDLSVIVLYSPWSSPLKYCYATIGLERSQELCRFVTKTTSPVTTSSGYNVYAF